MCVKMRASRILYIIFTLFVNAILQLVKETSTVFIMVEFAVTAAGHFFAEHTRKLRLQIIHVSNWVTAETLLQEETLVQVAWRMKMKGEDLCQILHTATLMLRQGHNAKPVGTSDAST